MGMFLGIIRKIQLIQMKSNLQWKVHLICQAKMAATAAAAGLLQVGTDYDADSLVNKKLQERQYKLKILEEKLDTQKAEYEDKLQMVNSELQSVEEEIKSGIQSSFSYNLG